ncbi:hypothetical protein [Rheinheimera hassiensis]|uniref:hypothetical protein n=1 Tax=Rheinheimera hassiensis TaxID=1193627 RepID=UPI001F060B62|nr:hypothetical protein [Rheinheimera hassiensis]
MELPNIAKHRAERIKEYCCVRLFSAIEDPKGYGEIQVRHTKFTGESAWYIEVPEEVVGGNNIILFCPWCGSKLPNKPPKQ